MHETTSRADPTLADPGVREERRRFGRVEAVLLGRCLFADGRETPVKVENMSAGGVVFSCGRPPEVGTSVIAYIDHIGRVEGRVSRSEKSGFAMEIAASARKREKLADSLTWLANRNVLGLREGRRHLRRAPRRSSTRLQLADGTSLSCEIIDVSLSGAALQTTARPRLGTAVRVGRVGGRVVRHFEDGVAIEFMRSMSDTTIEHVLDEDFF